jgi:S1-C subfamily serine protease
MVTGKMFRTGVLAPGFAMVALVAAGVAGAAEPAQPDRAAMEKQLEDARARLDDAARDVSELSRQLYGGDERDVVKFVRGPGRGAMIGVNIATEKPRDEGVEIVGVSPGGPAAAAGLKAGDVIVAVNGKALRKSPERPAAAQLVDTMRSTEPGQTVKLDYLRDGKRQSVDVRTEAAEPPFARILRDRHAMPIPEVFEIPAIEGLLGGGRSFRSLELVSMTPKLGQYFGTEQGLLVVRAPADRAFQLEEGDVLLAIDGRVPDSPQHAFRILGSYQPGEKLKLDVQRMRKKMQLQVTVPAGGSAGLQQRGPHPMPMPAQPLPPPPPAPRSNGPV